MGRPLNSRYFGPTTDSGEQFSVEAWVPGAGSNSNSVEIVRQRTNNRYEVTDGSNTGVCVLQDTTPTSEGEMRISVSPFSGGTEYAAVVNAHDVKTFNGNTYQWTPADESANEAGEADLPTS